MLVRSMEGKLTGSAFIMSILVIINISPLDTPKIEGLLSVGLLSFRNIGRMSLRVVFCRSAIP
jgi:hypothetical protein